MAVLPPHVLVCRLDHLQRQIYASMPWGYRVAHLFTVLGADGASTAGRSAYALFIAAAVRGMPSINGRDALDLVRDIRGPEDADRLPPDYGAQFGRRLYRVLLARFGPEIAEDAIAETLMKIARGKVHVRTGANLSEAEALVVTVGLNNARDLARKQGRARAVSDVDEEGRTLDVEDPEAFAKLERALSPRDMQRILQDLEDVHPRARSFAEAVLEGDSKADVAEAWSVTPSYVSKWLKQYGGAIRKVIEYRLREARCRYSYDRRDVAVVARPGYGVARTSAVRCTSGVPE